METKIASVTMVGHFPHGLDLHVRNLKWFLEATDYHIYIITLPRVLEHIDISSERVSLITRPTPHDAFTENAAGFVNFWRWFPAIIEHYQIDPEWFLLMEQDLWFFERFDSVPETDTVKTFFSEKGNYHSVMLGDRVLQPHLWEGTHLINAAIIKRAIDFKVDFGYRATSFLDRHREHYERLFGDKLSICMWAGPETLTEFSLYCALEERVGWCEAETAVHLQGPELLHRKYPLLYQGYDESLLERARREVPYIDVYAALAAYYIAGNWNDVTPVKWENAGPGLRNDLRKVAPRAREWMSPQQHSRFLEVIDSLDRAPRTGASREVAF